ncbi:MAG: ferritin-like domain-containing protein [Ignisphaera sp.]|uniref:Ferritin-like domain-containing protein n=1 Tax=Ignisphaera aggregans TaxID=334771 RepID=A0A7J3I6V7_9CREN
MSGEQFVELFKELVDMERKHAERLKNLADRIGHPVLKVLLLGIADDSEKHALFYQAMVELSTRYQPAISQEEFRMLGEEIIRHIETEARMMEVTKELLNRFSDPRLKLLLAAVHDDEVKHHRVLVSIRDNVGGEYVVGEEDMWNAIWRDSPWHGTPGG